MQLIKLINSTILFATLHAPQILQHKHQSSISCWSVINIGMDLLAEPFVFYLMGMYKALYEENGILGWENSTEPLKTPHPSCELEKKARESSNRWVQGRTERRQTWAPLGTRWPPCTPQAWRLPLLGHDLSFSLFCLSFPSLSSFWLTVD